MQKKDLIICALSILAVTLAAYSVYRGGGDFSTARAM